VLRLEARSGPDRAFVRRKLPGQPAKASSGPPVGLIVLLVLVVGAVLGLAFGPPLARMVRR